MGWVSATRIRSRRRVGPPVEEIQRRREELGFSYFVFGAEVSDALAPVVAELAAT
jgi:hypothetical protein